MIELAANAVASISKASGRNAKIDMLRKFRFTEGFKEIMQFIYNPYIHTGIAKKKLDKGLVPDNTANYAWQEIIEHFTRNQTGSTHDVMVAKAFIAQYPVGTAAHTLAIAIVTKTLKIGITEKTLNQVYGDDFIPMIGIMKAEKYDEFKTKVKGPFIATEKLDGARRILVKEYGFINIYSRSGIPDSGLFDIEAEARELPDNCMYDGECLAIGDFDNAIELRQASNSLANTKGVRTGLTFNIFDMVPIADFKRGISTHTARERKVMLSALFGDESIECLVPATYKEIIKDYKIPYDFKFIKVVPIEGVVNTEEEIMSLAEPIWRRGFEGLMLNTFTGKYDITKDRSRDILKVKNVVEMTLKVIDVEIGRPGTANENRLGSLILDYKGFRVGCGSGLDHVMRDKWWANPELIIGKTIEIDCFGESKNQQGGTSLNCPIFKRVVGAE
jgi:DNA ligase-1